jgi:hypothetical protein
MRQIAADLRAQDDVDCGLTPAQAAGFTRAVRS